ncbi:MAG: ATP-binding protein [Clostridia bacterium]|nr:ATP-binding protein [Clostridia bacterium]
MAFGRCIHNGVDKKSVRRFLLKLSVALFVILPFAFPAFANESAGNAAALKVAFPNLDGFTMTSEDGTRYGLVVDYLNEIAKYTGWKYEYIDTTNEMMLEEFLEGRFDLMGGTYYAPAFEQYFGYPEYSCGASRSVILAKWDDTSIRGFDYSDLNGKTIGVYDRADENIRRLKEFLAMEGLDCEIIAYSIDQLVDGSLKYYLENEHVDLLLGNAADDTGEYRCVAYFNAQPHYIVTVPGNRTILDQMNKALTYILESNPDFAEECYEKNFPDAGSRGLVLNDDEREYVKSKKVVTVALPELFHPFYCVDDESCSHNGIVVDILSIVADFSGLEFEYIFADTYAAALQIVLDGDADVLGFFLGDEAHSESMELALTQSYTTLTDQVIRNNSVTYPDDNLICALLEGRRLPSNIKAKAVYYKTMYDMLSAVNDGEADIAYGLSPMIEKQSQQNIFRNLFSVSLFDNTRDISFAIPRPVNANLLTIFNKALNSISSTRRTAIGSANLVFTGTSRLSLRNIVYSNPVLVIVVFGAFILLIGTILIIVSYSRVRSLRIQGELDRAEATSRAKGLFLSHMSHEIRTPINGIVGMTELMKRHIDNNDMIRDYIEKIQLSSQHLLALINDVLDMSKIESGKVELHSDPFDLGLVLRGIKATFDVQAQSKQISFNLIVNGRFEDALIGDSLRLNQILTNLLSNAVKFTPNGGEITLSVEEIRHDGGKTRVAFEVRDTGCGISSENIDRVFMSFEQEHSSVTSVYGGTGLGLSITKRFVEMMGGEISVTSRVNAGSTFRVELPFGIACGKRCATSIENSAEKDDPARYFEGLNLLVVEDNAINMQVALGLLEYTGAHVDAAFNGLEAIDKFKGSPEGFYDLILMDVRMPVMDGMSATRAIRALPRSDAKSVLIFAMTANALSTDAQNCIKSGMNAHIGKPFMLKDIYNAYLQMT